MSGHSGLKTNELTLISAWDAVLYPSLELKVHAIIQNIIIEHFRDPHANIHKIQKHIYIYIYILLLTYYVYPKCICSCILVYSVQVHWALSRPINSFVCPSA